MYEWNDGSELYHAWLKKGAQAKDHKYIARVGTSPNYKYFYTNAEYQIYLRKEQLKNSANSFKNNLASRTNIIKSNLISRANSFKNTVTLKTNSIGANAKNRLNSLSNAGSKNKIQIAINNKASNIKAASKNVLSSVNNSKVKKAAENIKGKVGDSLKDISNGIKQAKKLVSMASKKNIHSMAEEYAIERGNILSNYKNKATKGYVFAGILGGTAISVVLAKKANNALSELYNRFSAKRDEMISQIESKSPENFDEVKKKTKPMSKDEDMARVNPYYEEGDIFKINCSYCTLAYEMRRRGYDVEADDYHGGIADDEEANVFEELYSWYTHDGKKVDDNKAMLHYEAYYKSHYLLNLQKYKGDEETARVMTMKEAYENAYPGAKYYDTRLTFTDPKTGKMTTAYSEMINDIKSQGEGARGQFLLYWKEGGGHSVAYEVENGEVVIRDCQTGQKVDPKEYYSMASEVMYFRTDNEDINENALKGVKNKQSDTVNDPKNPEEKAAAFKKAGYSFIRYEWNSSEGYTYALKGPDGNYYKWSPDTGQFIEIKNAYDL